jgi:hypothetical protein
MIDGTTISGHSINGKEIVVLDSHFNVALLALEFDKVLSKKANVSANQTINSLKEELGEKGVCCIHGITSDAFGAARLEALLILKERDQCAERVHQVHPLYLIETIEVVTNTGFTRDLFFDDSGPFAQLRLHLCMAHNIQSVLGSTFGRCRREIRSCSLTFHGTGQVQRKLLWRRKI